MVDFDRIKSSKNKKLYLSPRIEIFDLDTLLENTFYISFYVEIGLKCFEVSPELVTFISQQCLPGDRQMTVMGITVRSYR